MVLGSFPDNGAISVDSTSLDCCDYREYYRVKNIECDTSIHLKAGQVVKVIKTGETYLVGDVNINDGQCNCCPAFPLDSKYIEVVDG